MPQRSTEPLHAFHGGLRMPAVARVDCTTPAIALPLPERLYVPLKQHQGPPATPLVTIGQRVGKGQLLATGDSPRAVPVHAPTSGTVVALCEVAVSWPPGTRAECVEIEPDGEDRWAQREPLKDSSATIAHLHALGLSGLGGAMFPTAAKLDGGWPALHTIILNGAECEPWIACDQALLRERGAAVLEGGRRLAQALGAQRVVVAIKDQPEPPALEPDAAGEGLVDIRIVRLPSIYPQGSERQLIHTLTGQEVPHDGLPQDLGVVCVNVATACAARDAIVDGTPVIERIVTVTGPGIVAPCNVRALIGTPIQHLLDAAGGCTADMNRLIVGGPLSGLPLADPQTPVVKGTNCILALTHAAVRRAQPPMPCINCGECVRVCPSRLLPQLLFKHIAAADLDGAQELNLHDCIECGSCAAVCPSHLPLVDYYRHGKAELAQRRRNSARAEQARLRFEQRAQRLAALQAARQARRRAREQALADPDRARDAVAEAIRRASRKKP